MQKRIRQLILGLGTFGTGTVLLSFDIHPVLLIITDAAAGLGLLVAAGSITARDLHLRREPGPRERPLPESAPAAGGGGQARPRGLRASLRRLSHSLRSGLGRGKARKDEKDPRMDAIDRMLDRTLTGQSERIISLAEGRRAHPESAPPVRGSPGLDGDPFQDLSDASIETPLIEVGPDVEIPVPVGGEIPVPAAAGIPAREGKEEAPGELTPLEVPALPPEVPMGGGGTGEALPDVLTLTDETLGTEDLLAALKREALKEKKRDDTSLLRDLRGLKITGKQLLDELDSVVRDLKGK